MAEEAPTIIVIEERRPGLGALLTAFIVIMFILWIINPNLALRVLRVIFCLIFRVPVICS
jgi:hypothetical protein